MSEISPFVRTLRELEDVKQKLTEYFGGLPDDDLLRAIDTLTMVNDEYLKVRKSLDDYLGTYYSVVDEVDALIERDSAEPQVTAAFRLLAEQRLRELVRKDDEVLDLRERVRSLEFQLNRREDDLDSAMRALATQALKEITR